MRQLRWIMPGLATVLSVLALGGGTPGSVAAVGTAPAVKPFKGAVVPLGATLRRRMTGRSWHRGCPVPLRKLRVVAFRHHGFDGRIHSGRLVVNAARAGGVLAVMKILFRRRYPIRQARLVDAFGADDHRSMAADNSSSFNCRVRSDRPWMWSQHAYGLAIDLNPVENPWVQPSGWVSPPAGRSFANRSRHRPGMIHRRGGLVRAFARHGWKWAGNWHGPWDYMHFSTSGQ